jgi:transposase InsO family protein
MSLMISLFCISWLLLHGRKKYLFINIVSATAVLYITALTGGRKYLLVPFIFFLLLLILKNWTTNKLRLVIYLFLYLLVVLFAVWAVINIPALYYSVGVRFEGLMSFFEGNLANPDASTAVRYMMIDNGWHWFLRQPILGYGLNSFAFMFSPILYDVYAHNNYIELLVDLGILGFLAYYSFYVYITAKLIRIQHDSTGLRSFFLAYMLALPIFEVGAVTYQYFPVQIFLGLASAYVWLYEKGRIVQPVVSPSAADSQEWRKGMTSEEKLVQQRLSVLQLAERLDNVSEACRQRGVSRTQFYEYKRRYELHGMEGLKNLPVTRNSHSPTRPPEVKKRILTMSMEHPDWGRARLSNQLKLDGLLVSASTVQYTLIKNDMSSKCQRLLQLEKQALQHTIELTSELIDQIEKANPCFRERHVESSRPAELLSQDMIYLGQLKSVGNVYLHTVVDTYGSYAFGFLDTSNKLEAAVALLQNEVLPFYQRLGLRVNAILTNYSHGFSGNNIRPYKTYLNLHKIEYQHPKVRRLQPNGFTERFNRTVLDEFFRPAFRRKLYENVGALQRDLDVWLVHYNTERAHQGYRNMGKRPIDTIRDYLKTVQEETSS